MRGGSFMKAFARFGSVFCCFLYFTRFALFFQYTIIFKTKFLHLIFFVFSQFLRKRVNFSELNMKSHFIKINTYFVHLNDR